MKYTSILAVAFVGFIARDALAWENKQAHPTINERAFDLFLQTIATGAKYERGAIDREMVMAGPAVTAPGYFNITTGTQSGTVRNWLAHGGYSADEPEIIMSLRHFFDPLAKEQYYLTDIVGDTAVSNPAIDARTWAIDGPSSVMYPENDFSWVKGLAYYRLAMVLETDREENLAKAFRALGETMHLLGDMTQPAHVRNDGHPTGDSDAIEDAVTKTVIDGLDVTQAPAVTIAVTGPELLFQNVASYTNATFYSDDTIADSASGVKPYNGKPPYEQPSFAGLTYQDGVVSRGSDRLLEQTLTGYLFGTNAAKPFHVPAAFAPDYARHLIPLAVQANARLVDMFLPDLSLTLSVQEGTDTATVSGELVHKPDSVWTQAIAYSGPGTLCRRGGQSIAEVTFSAGVMAGRTVTLAKGDVIYLEVKAGGRILRSPEVTIQGPAPESLLTKWQAKTGATFEFTGRLTYDNGEVQTTDPPGLTFLFTSTFGTGIKWSGASFSAKKVTTTGPMSMPGDREVTWVETLALAGTMSADGRTLLSVRAEDIQTSTSVYADGHSEVDKDTAILEAKDLPLTSDYAGQFLVSADVRSHVVHVEQTDAVLKQSSINNAEWTQAALVFTFQ
jgi:hypothetical protein